MHNIVSSGNLKTKACVVGTISVLNYVNPHKENDWNNGLLFIHERTLFLY